MASQTMFLFVNKDSTSPSLSRNTGREAAIASKINKHVQQQRFRKGSVSRKNWYRPFTRSDSSGPSTPTSTGSSFEPEMLATPRSFSQSTEKSSRSPPKKIAAPIRKTPSLKKAPRSIPPLPLPLEENKDSLEKDSPKMIPFPQNPIFSRSGDSNDPFNNTAQPITPALRDVLARHLHWAVSSSVSAFTIQEGVRRILSTIMTDHMHSTAFLAMATAQQRRTANVVLPQSEGADFYRYKATKLIREHIIANGSAIDPYTFVDVFRLAMCEWLNGNHQAARVHFSYISQVWRTFRPHDWGEQHNLEVISSEDIFLAIDIDEKPLLDLNWVAWLDPDLSLQDVKLEPDTEASFPGICHTRTGFELRRLILETSPLHDVILSCLNSLHSTLDFSKADFAKALKGPLWVIKRRMHATMHRLQTVSATELTSVEDVLRRTFIILLFLSTTTPERRLARTDLLQLASRLKEAIHKVCLEKRHTDAKPSFWLWVMVAGLIAVQEAMVAPDQLNENIEEVRSWFSDKCIQVGKYLFDENVTVNAVRHTLMAYMYFECVQEHVIPNVVDMIRLGESPTY